MRQRAGQQNLLFFRQRTAVDGAAYVEADVKLGQRLARQLAQPPPAKGDPRLRQPVEHDVFRDAHARDQRDVNLLLHQMDPQLFGIARRANAYRLVVNHHLAFVMGVRAAQHRHERGLTRAVGAGQRMHRSPRQGESHVAERPKAGKGQANILHLKAIAGHPLHPVD